MKRRTLVILLARLDASPLPLADPVRLDLESELMEHLNGCDVTPERSEPPDRPPESGILLRR